MLTYLTPICLANVRSSAVKSFGICSEILIPGESASSGWRAACAVARQTAPPTKIRANSRRLLTDLYVIGFDYIRQLRFLFAQQLPRLRLRDQLKSNLIPRPQLPDTGQ